MQIFRFVDSASVVRLDLNSTTGWYLGRGLDLGGRSLTSTFLSQPGYDGSTLASSNWTTSPMRIPLFMRKQASATAMLALVEALTTELDRETNILEVRPTGYGTSFLIDTFRAPVPTLLHGQDVADIFMTLEAGADPLVLVIERQPKSRGAGTYL